MSTRWMNRTATLLTIFSLAGAAGPYAPTHVKVDFSEFEYGWQYKRIRTDTSDEDCPESTAMLGPLSPRKYETRLAMMLRCSPVIECLEIAAFPPSRDSAA